MKLDPVKRAIVPCAVLFAVAAMGWAWLARSGAAAAAAAAEAAQQGVAELKVAVEEARQHAAPDPAVAQGPKWRLPDSPEVTTTLRLLGTVAESVGVVMDTIRPLPANEPGRQTFALAGHAAAAKVCEFLAAIEQHPRLLLIENGKVRAGSADEVTFELGLATFHTGGTGQ